ncbi:hypothetical protein RYX36_007938 [Vicia faba]
MCRRDGEQLDGCAEKRFERRGCRGCATEIDDAVWKLTSYCWQMVKGVVYGDDERVDRNWRLYNGDRRREYYGVICIGVLKRQIVLLAETRGKGIVVV